MSKHVVIVGAGPGGLTSAMILAKRGFQVTVCEKDADVGGRNKAIKLGKYKFDTGPTFLMLKPVLDEVFEEAGRRSDKYLKLLRLDPMYRLVFGDGMAINPTDDHAKMKAEIERLFPGDGAGLDKYFAYEAERFRRMYACLQKTYSSPADFFSKEFRGAFTHLSIGKSLMDILRGYFRNERLALSFTFQAKYLGMSPWECPGAFTIISYIEHEFGVWHTRGGLSEISQAMAKVTKEHGGKIRLRSTVKKLIVENKVAKGVELADGERIMADEVIINEDFAHAMTHRFGTGMLKKYSPKKLAKKRYSCSIFMLYLGVNKLYKIPHHAIYFADDYKANVKDIFNRKRLSRDTSFYVRNASINDPTLAPKGHSALYVLVPVANLAADIDWTEERESFRDLVIDTIERKTIMKDLRKHITAEKIITPLEWYTDYNVYNGATFNLAHNLGQMLYFRPHNKFEEVDRTYIVGGGAHPGSGLPTIYESGRIAANLISKKYGVSYVSKNNLAG